MDEKDWVIVGAMLLGPILAVQAQKAVESIRERRQRKSRVFETLMATRMARLSGDHVQALNMIDLVFYGRRVFGIPLKSKSEQAVVAAWREYLDSLGASTSPEENAQWQQTNNELFVNLLAAIGDDVGHTFDRVQLKKGAYSPMAHGTLENEHTAIRKLVIEVLSGEKSLRMDVASLPLDADALAQQLDLQRKMAASYSEGALTVRVRSDDGPPAAAPASTQKP